MVEALVGNTFEVEIQEKMDIVFVGHVDHGKSTVIGRLLADTGTLPEGKLEQVRESCERNSKPFEYAYLIDALKDERAQSITIDSARVFFKSQKRHYIIIDAPGHIEFIKNMVTGASRAEAAVLVIDALEGIQENSRRHGYLLWMLGIKQIVVLVNKMDLVGYKQEVFDSICAEYNQFLGEIGVQPLCYIPVSGRMGDNVAALSENTSWYDGFTVLTALDSFEKAKPLTDKPFRLPVQDIYKFTLFGDDRRIVSGTVSSGTMRVGDELVFYPSGKSSVVKSIETFSAPVKDKAFSGEAIGFTLNEQIYIRRGQIAARADEPAPKVATRLRVSLFWLGKHPMIPKKQYILKLGTARVKVQIETIHRIIDASDYSTLNDKNQIEHHDVAECTLTLSHPLALDLSETMTDTSRFVIVDDYEIWGGGIVLEAIKDENTELLEEVVTRDRKWVKTTVTMSQRAERYNQRPTLLIVTGQKGMGRKRFASLLERQLFEGGKYVYYLGIGSFLYGVGADLKRQNPGDNWHEHIRRMAEAAHLFLDSGMILIMTAVELTQDDLKVFNTIINPNQIETIWIGDQVTTDINYDLQVVGDEENVERSVIQVKRMLQDHGIIFSP